MKGWDAEVTILDEMLELLALSHQVGLFSRRVLHQFNRQDIVASFEFGCNLELQFDSN